MKTSEQTTTLIAALVVARGQFKPIVRDVEGQVGTSRKIRYADLAAILDATIKPLLTNGLVLLQSLDAETSSLITRLAHTSGEWVESIYPLKIDPNPQAFGSALTYGRRYSITSLLCLAAADDDGAAPAHAKVPPTEHGTVKPKPDLSAKKITEKQQRRMYVIASNAGWTSDQVKTYLVRHAGIESSADIRADHYDALCDVFGTPYEPEGNHT